MIKGSSLNFHGWKRFYSRGSLAEEDVVHYVRTNALMYEYYKQARELVTDEIGTVLQRLFDSESFQIVNTRQVLWEDCIID